MASAAPERPQPSPPPGPAAPALEKEGASADDIECRELAAREDLCCFISFAGPEDGALGLGIFSHPRTPQQRRAGLPPDFDIVGDYVEAESFNEGLRRAPTVVSSARRRINGWIPMYINAQHWAAARRYLPSALANLAGWDTQRGLVCQHGEAESPAAEISPEDLLDVCCSLLTCAVVGFTVGQPEPQRPRRRRARRLAGDSRAAPRARRGRLGLERRPGPAAAPRAAGVLGASEPSTPRSAARGKASERAVQMYAEVHRLLLQVAEEFAGVRELACARLWGFISDPAMRTQDATPSLGGLVHCLLIAEEVTWEDLAPALLPEALRRHAVRQRIRGRAFDAREHGGSRDALVEAWDHFAMPAGLVTSFCVTFCQQVGRPRGASLQGVVAAYDRRWGRLRAESTAHIISTCARLARCKSLVDILEMLLPSESRVNMQDRAAELILWADRYGRRRDVGAIHLAAWPSLAGSCPLLREWQARQELCEQPRHDWRRCGYSQRRRAPRHRAARWVPREEVQRVEESGGEERWWSPGGEAQAGPGLAPTSDDALWVSRWRAHPDLYPLFLEWLQSRRYPHATAPFHHGPM